MKSTLFLEFFCPENRSSQVKAGRAWLAGKQTYLLKSTVSTHDWLTRFCFFAVILATESGFGSNAPRTLISFGAKSVTGNLWCALIARSPPGARSSRVAWVGQFWPTTFISCHPNFRVVVHQVSSDRSTCYIDLSVQRQQFAFLQLIQDSRKHQSYLAQEHFSLIRPRVMWRPEQNFVNLKLLGGNHQNSWPAPR